MEKTNAKIFQEMRSADEHKREMQGGIMERMRNSEIGQKLGAAYDSPLAQGIVGGLQDAYRRMFENGWYQKDIFDGRFQMDTKGPQGLQGMDRQYDHRASFYGVDQQQKPVQNQGIDESQGLSYSRGR